MSDASDFENMAQSGAKIIPTSAGAIKKGGVVVINDRPCRVTAYSTCKTGKHGAAKASITGVDIFTKKKMELSASTGSTVFVPIVQKNDVTVVDVNDGFVSYMDADGEIHEDVPVPEDEVGQRLVALFGEGKQLIATLQSAMDETAVVDVREGQL